MNFCSFGMDACSRHRQGGRTVRGALIFCVCDLPAGRSLCGFKTHTACCSKCKFKFHHFETDKLKKKMDKSSGVGTIPETTINHGNRATLQKSKSLGKIICYVDPSMLGRNLFMIMTSDIQSCQSCPISIVSRCFASTRCTTFGLVSPSI